MTDTSCALVRLAPGTGETLWRTGISPDDCASHALTEPVIEDVDGDGTMEVVVSTAEEAMIAYDATDGSEEWRVSLQTYGYGRPTVANVTAAPGPEIVTSDIGGNVVVVDGDGTPEWRFSVNTTPLNDTSIYAAPIVDDVDADGGPEILFGSRSGSILLAADGTVECTDDGSATYITAADVDDDGPLEVFTAGLSGVRALDGSTGSEEWVKPFGKARIGAIADADDDGSVELYAGHYTGTVYALDAESGDTEWSTTVSTTNGTIIPPPVLGDADGDGGEEVIAVSKEGGVRVLDPGSGDVLGVYEREVPIWTFPTPADIDGDGNTEILARYGDGRVVALEYA
jgi:outer membrane protein assembly factor BamB